MHKQKISTTKKILKKLLLSIIVFSTSKVIHLLITLTDKNFHMIYCTSLVDNSDQPLNLSKIDNDQIANNKIESLKRSDNSDEQHNSLIKDNNQTINYEKDISTETYDSILVNLKQYVNKNHNLSCLQHTSFQNFMNQEANNFKNDDFYAREKSSKRKKESILCYDCPNPKVTKLSCNKNNEKKKITTVASHFECIDLTKILQKNSNENIQDDPQENYNKLAYATKLYKNDNIYETSQSSSFNHSKLNWKRKLLHKYLAKQTEKQKFIDFQTENCESDKNFQSYSGNSIEVKLIHNKQLPESEIIIIKDKIKVKVNADKSLNDINIEFFIQKIAKKYDIINDALINFLKDKNCEVYLQEITESQLKLSMEIKKNIKNVKNDFFEYKLKDLSKYVNEENKIRLESYKNVKNLDNEYINKLNYIFIMIDNLILHSEMTNPGNITHLTDFMRFYICFIEALYIQKDENSESSYKTITTIYNLFRILFLFIKKLSHKKLPTILIDEIYKELTKNSSITVEEIKFMNSGIAIKENILTTKKRKTKDNIYDFEIKFKSIKLENFGFEKFKRNIINDSILYITSEIEKDKIKVKIQRRIFLQFLKMSSCCFKKNILGKKEKDFYNMLTKKFINSTSIKNKSHKIIKPQNINSKTIYLIRILTIIDFLIRLNDDILLFLDKVNKEIS